MRKQFIAFDSFHRDATIKNSYLISLALIFLSFLILVIFYFQLPPHVPLFYSQVRGETQLAAKGYLFLLPIFSLIMLLLHFWVSRVNFNSDRMLSKITASTSAFITFLLFIALVHIVVIVT